MKLSALAPAMCAALHLAFCSSVLSATATDTLKDIKPAGGMCRADVPTNLPVVETSLASSVVDSSCNVTAKRASQLLHDGTAVAIDVRTSAEFERFHIDGAWNLPGGAVKTKAFLKNRTLLLIGSGKAERELNANCVLLKRQGFKQTFLLHGGIAAWRVNQLPMVGEEPDVSSLTKLSTADFYAEVSNRMNHVYVTPSIGKLKKDVPSATVIEKGEVARAVAAEWSRERQRGRSADVMAIVVAVDPAAGAVDFTSISTALRPQPVLIYSEGVAAYRRFLETQKAVWTAHARGPKVPPCSTR